MARDSNLSDESPDGARSPRNSRLKRKTLAGLDLDPEGEDDEYNEDFEDSNVKDEEEDDEEEDVDDPDDVDEAEYNDEDEAVVKTTRGRRGRKRKATTDDPEDFEEDGEGTNDQNNAVKSEIQNEDNPKSDDKEDGKADVEKVGPGRKKGKKRGRKPKIPRPEDVMFDDKGNEIDIKNDEVVVENEDPKGLEKIDENGFLKGDRKFRIKTFTLLGKGDRQYMVSTEPARLVGFRDSYLLFKTHLSLFKKVCTHEEKMDLIQRHLIPTSYKGRSVNLVTARSIFREFGARMIVEGKKVIDDFWEEKARERGDVEGEYADPEEASVKGGNFTGDSYSGQVTGSALINYQSDPTWMYQVALQTQEFNKSLAEARNQTWLRGVKDTYSGFNFYPTASQPSRSNWKKLANSSDERTIECSLNMFMPNIRRTVTGLAGISADVLNEIDDDEVKRAIIEQQKFEKSMSVLN